MTTAHNDPLAPVHPGEILKEDFLIPLGMKPYTLAKHMRLSRARVERLIRGETSISPDTALRLEKLFGASAEFWIGIQGFFDLETARRSANPEIQQIEPLPRVA